MPTSKDIAAKKKKARRRPGREEYEASEAIIAASEPETEISETPSEEDTFGHHHPDPEHEAGPGDEASERKKIRIEFPYSQVVRSRIPKAFEVAENVAEEWVNDGNFENIPVGHPLAQITVAAGLRKAKAVEKKLEEKGVFAMAKMGLEFAKSKLKK